MLTGTIAAVNVLAIFFISLSVIPTLLFLLHEPKPRQLKHLDRKWVFKLV